MLANKGKLVDKLFHHTQQNKSEFLEMIKCLTNQINTDKYWFNDQGQPRSFFKMGIFKMVVQKGKEMKSVSEMFWHGILCEMNSQAEKGAEEIFKEIKI